MSFFVNPWSHIIIFLLFLFVCQLRSEDFRQENDPLYGNRHINQTNQIILPFRAYALNDLMMYKFILIKSRIKQYTHK